MIGVVGWASLAWAGPVPPGQALWVNPGANFDAMGEVTVPVDLSWLPVGVDRTKLRFLQGDDQLLWEQESDPTARVAWVRLRDLSSQTALWVEWDSNLGGPQAPNQSSAIWPDAVGVWHLTAGALASAGSWQMQDALEGAPGLRVAGASSSGLRALTVTGGPLAPPWTVSLWVALESSLPLFVVRADNVFSVEPCLAGNAPGLKLQWAITPTSCHAVDLADGAWHHLAISAEFGSGYSLWVDGVRLDRVERTTDLLAEVKTHVLLMGVVDELRISHGETVQEDLLAGVDVFIPADEHPSTGADSGTVPEETGSLGPPAEGEQLLPPPLWKEARWASGCSTGPAPLSLTWPGMAGAALVWGASLTRRRSLSWP